MIPYYDRDGITIYHGDSLEVLPKLGKVDVVLTDPPYNTPDIGKNHRKYANTTFPMSDENYALFCRGWFEACIRLTERAIFTPGIAHAWLYPQPRWIIAWHKPSAVGFNRMGGFNVWEPILVYGAPPNRINQDHYTLVPRNHLKGVERNHPCPKPVELWRWILSKVSKEDEVVLDPFVGSGTTLVSAKLLGRKAVGIEVEEKYCEMAATRLGQEVMSL